MSVSSGANAIVSAAIQRAVDAGTEIGVQVAAYYQGQLAIDTWGGLADPTTGRTVDGETLFNVYSVAKAVTATALHMQVARGLIEYDAPIARYWPEYAAHGKEKTTVRHALTHRAGLPQMPEGVTPERMCDWDWMVRGIAALKPLAEPGTRRFEMTSRRANGWIVVDAAICTEDDDLRRWVARGVAHARSLPPK